MNNIECSTCGYVYKVKNSITIAICPKCFKLNYNPKGELTV